MATRCKGKSGRRRQIGVLLAVLLACVCISGVEYYAAGLVSNIAVHKGKVYFAQGHRTLTVLNMDTGDVLERRKDWTRGWNRLMSFPEGMLVLHSGEATFLDPETMKVFWHDNMWGYKVGIDNVLCHDETGTRLREIRTGKVVWEFNKGKLVDVVGDKVIHQRHWDPLKAEIPATIWVVDLKSGRQVVELVAPPLVEYFRVRVGDNSIFVVSGKVKEYVTTKFGKLMRDRWARHEELLEFDMQGNLLSTTPLPKEMQVGEHEYCRFDPFDIVEHKLNWDGRMTPASKEKLKPSESRESTSQYEFENKQDTRGGVLDFQKATTSDGVVVSVIRYKRADVSWSGVVSYLNPEYAREDLNYPPRLITCFAESQDALVFGSRRGFVERIDLQSGISKWLYRCGSNSIETSGHYKIRLTTLERDYHRWIEGKEKTPGTILLPEGMDLSKVTYADLMEMGWKTPTRVIVDPQPVDPYPELGRWLFMCYSGALIPLAVLVAVWQVFRRKAWPEWVPAILAPCLTVVPWYFLLHYWQVGLLSTIAMKLSILFLSGFAVWISIRLYRKRRWVVGSVPVVLAIVPLIWLWEVLWFA